MTPPHPRRHWMPTSLGARLLLGAAALILLALSLTALALETTLHRFVQAQVDGRLDGQLATIIDALRRDPDGRLSLERSVDGPPFDRPDSGWSWEVLAPEPVLTSGSRDPAPLALGETDRHGPPSGPEQDRRGSPIRSCLSFLPGGAAMRGPNHDCRPRAADARGSGVDAPRARLREVMVGGRPATVVATAPARAVWDPLRDVMVPVGAILVLLAAALLAGVLVQVRLGLRPLGRLRAELARVRAGRMDRIGGPQPREVRPLVTELNLLLDENHANLERARRNVANLAHGLKTPLATLALALTEPGGAPESPLRPLVDRMDRLIRHHLARARAAALGGAGRGRVAVPEAVAGHVAVFTKLYADKGLVFEVRLPEDLTAAVEAQDLDEMLGNVIDNACKWARGRVLIAGTVRRQRIGLSIEDDGPGVPTGQVDDMLKPGRRIDESAPGHGFGLPITRELVELYGGSLVLVRSGLGGLGVSMDLPAAA